MNPEQFVSRRETVWRGLEALLKRVRDGHVSRLNDEELRELGRLYRLVVGDLALAQRDFPRHAVTRYLNELVGRAHHQVYQAPPAEGWRTVLSMILTLPRIFRASWRYQVAAALLFWGPGVLTYILTLTNPDLVYLLLPPQMHALIPMVEGGELWTEINAPERALASASILTNNIQVSFLAFAGGAVLGLLTIYVLIYNGLILGTIFGFVQAHGLGLGLLDFVISHGVVELSVISIAGGSGLMMGHALLSPGLMRRRDAFAAATQNAVRLVGGCAVALIFAGLIEGFISPSSLPFALKAMVGLGTGLVLWTYLLLVGWGRTQ